MLRVLAKKFGLDHIHWLDVKQLHGDLERQYSKTKNQIFNRTDLLLSLERRDFLIQRLKIL